MCLLNSGDGSYFFIEPPINLSSLGRGKIRTWAFYRSRSTVGHAQNRHIRTARLFRGNNMGIVAWISAAAKVNVAFSKTWFRLWFKIKSIGICNPLRKPGKSHSPFKSTQCHFYRKEKQGAVLFCQMNRVPCGVFQVIYKRDSSLLSLSVEIILSELIRRVSGNLPGFHYYLVFTQWFFLL